MLTEQEKFLFLHYYFSSSKIIIKHLNEYNFFCSESKLCSPVLILQFFQVALRLARALIA